VEQQIKERDTLGNAIYPQSGNGIYYTGVVDMSICRRATLDVIVGTLGASGSVAAGLQYGNQANGSDATNMGIDLPVNIAVSNQQATIELYYGASEMAGRRYLRGYVLVNTIASQVAAMIRGTDVRYGPAFNYDNSTVNVRVAG
jgi:hypothetical protein